MFHHVFSMFYHVLSMFYLTILHSQFDKTLVSKIDSLWMWVVLRIDDRRDVYLPPPPCAEKVSEIIDDSRFKGTYIFLKCTHFFMFFMFNHSMHSAPLLFHRVSAEWSRVGLVVAWSADHLVEFCFMNMHGISLHLMLGDLLTCL